MRRCSRSRSCSWAWKSRRSTTMIACAGGDNIRCAPYATFGTQELSEHAARALEDRLACLLEHHGMIAIGPSLTKTMWLAGQIGNPRRQYHGRPQILNTP